MDSVKSSSLRAVQMAFALTIGATALHAQAKPSLAAQARVSRDSAQKLALAQVPGGRIIDGELEREKGKLIWSFDIRTQGKSGIDEVQIDAVSGALVSNEHETPRQERAEAAADRRAAARKAVPKP